MTPEQEARVGELRGRGIKRKEIAAMLGYSEKTISRVMNKPEIVAVAQTTREELVDPTAAGTLRELLGSKSEAIRLGAARALLLSKVPDIPEESESSSAPRITVVAAS
jgi:hypothetical protein